MLGLPLTHGGLGGGHNLLLLFKVTFKHFRKPLGIHMNVYGTLGQLFKVTSLCLPKNRLVQCSIFIYLFMYLFIAVKYKVVQNIA